MYLRALSELCPLSIWVEEDATIRQLPGGDADHWGGSEQDMRSSICISAVVFLQRGQNVARA